MTGDTKKRYDKELSIEALAAIPDDQIVNRRGIRTPSSG